MKQHEAVIEVMRANGGYATLGYLYQAALKVPGVVWNTKTPFKSINRIVQTHDEFFKVRPGLWALEEYRNSLPSVILEDSKSEDIEIQTFNHSYYQGLLLELGNWEEYFTYLPKQDRNRQFVDKPLASIANLYEIYPFTYPNLVKRASTIDVIWFNERGFPSKMYEVEHTTDIQNSLLKFVEFQDFHIGFHIVADQSRKTEFDRKINYQAFTSIRERVGFVNYEILAQLHSRSAETIALRNIAGL